MQNEVHANRGSLTPLEALGSYGSMLSIARAVNGRPAEYIRTNAYTADHERYQSSLARFRQWCEIHYENGITVAADVPQYEGITSSIGGLGRPSHASAERLKGGYQQVVRDDTHLNEALGEFLDGVIRMDHSEGQYTRVQYRFIAEADYIQQHRDVLAPFVEVVVPLDGGHLGHRPLFIYLAQNAAHRQSDRADIAQVRENIVQALAEDRRDMRALIVPHDRTLTVGILADDERVDESVVGQVAELYSRFGWDHDGVRGMLANQNNIFGVARSGEHIVSCGVAELAQVPIGETQFRIAELTEAATLRQYERRGIYTAISTNILAELERRSRSGNIFGGEIDLVFAEGNGLSQGVLRVARHQGRIFAAQVGNVYGFPGSGILHQQVRIEGPVNSRTSYNDLVVGFITRNALYDLV